MQKNCQKVLNILSENPEPVVDIFNLLNRFTLDSIGEIGFGTSIGSLENAVSPFLRSFDEAQRIVFRRFVLPGWRASVTLPAETDWVVDCLSGRSSVSLWEVHEGSEHPHGCQCLKSSPACSFRVEHEEALKELRVGEYEF